jgi:hypothetical protein
MSMVLLGQPLLEDCQFLAQRAMKYKIGKQYLIKKTLTVYLGVTLKRNHSMGLWSRKNGGRNG